MWHEIAQTPTIVADQCNGCTFSYLKKTVLSSMPLGTQF
jgi:hypothetical protein